MNYKQTLEYLYSSLPMFHRIGSAAYKPNLDNTIALCRLLGNPEDKFRSVHIAGTNGKGSTSHMLASVLQEAGLKVGLYTSPHLKDFRERIKINGKMISREDVVEFVNGHKEDFEKIRPSFFEMTVGMAFDYFAKKKVDIAVIEVGLGGRLDSTNVITPLLSVITNISYDHMNLLGDSLEKIAEEKAGIIKKNNIILIGEKQEEVRKVFERKAAEEDCYITYSEDLFRVSGAAQVKEGKAWMLEAEFTWPDTDERTIVRCGLPGMYQEKNLQTVLAAAYILKLLRHIPIDREQIKDGIEKVVKNTGLKGRWQILEEKPITIADTAHNEAGIDLVVKELKKVPHKKMHIVLGAVNDKDIGKILDLWPRKATYYFCKPDIPRGLPAEELRRLAKAKGLKGASYPSVKEAYRAAKENASGKDLIFVGGSTFVVGEVV